MKSSRLGFAIATLATAFVLTASASVFAQMDVGGIDGRVLDESKAAAPGATITAKNVATGLVRNVVSSATGTYRIGSLPAGEYEVTVEMAGFAKQTKRVTVQISSQTTADFTMSVSAKTETLTVVGEAPLISTTTSDVGQVISQRLVENIPLNGRKFQDLSLLVPGTHSASYYDPTKTEVGGISFGAGTGRSVIINVDGGDNNDGVVRGLLQQFSNDAVQEYKVTTQRYSAEYGRSISGVVNVITKSGTNDFHGAAFVFARNESLNAKTYFEEQAGVAKPDFSQQQFGGSIGGPIAKDKAHFFASYERNRRNDSVQVNTQGALPAEEHGVAKPFRNHLLTAKINLQIDDKNSAYVRYALEDQGRENDFVGGNIVLSSGAKNTNKIHSAIAKNTTVLGPSKINELAVLFSNYENNVTANDNTKPNVITPDFTYGANLNTPQQTIQRRFQVRDDFSFRKEGWGGDHAFKVGAELLRSHYGGFFKPTFYGAFYFNNSLPTLDSYLNGIADTFTGSAGDNVADDNWTYLGTYIQDDWKPTPRLTVNLGLRYEIQWGAYSNPFNSVTRTSLAEHGFPSQNKQDYNNVGPRVGFAYDVKGDAKLVLRGGYGLYYDEIFQNITLYEKWTDPATPLNFVTLSPPPYTPNQYIANSEAIKADQVDNTFAGQLVRLTAPDLEQPYSHHMNVGFSVQPAQNLAFDVDYVHAAGKQEIHRWQINTGANVNTRISPAGVFDDRYGPFRVEGNRGHSSFDGLYVAGKYRTSKTQFLATYAYGNGKNTANDFYSRPGGDQTGAETNGNWEADYGPALDDIRHRVTAAGIFQLPAGFQASTSLQWNTARPYSARVSTNPTVLIRANDPATGQPFPRNSFRTYNPLGTPEFAEFNGKDGRFFTWDARLSKMFNFGKERSLEVLFEVFNITNAVNFLTDNQQGFADIYGSDNFGTPTQIVPNSQRQAEFGVRFRF